MPSLLSVTVRALLATIAATASAIGLFLLSRVIFQAPYNWLNLVEVIVIPTLVAFPIAGYIFYQTDRLAAAKVALAEQARDNERQRLLIQELHHRIKNVLGTVMSLCAQTARGASEVQPFVEQFNGRLVALAGAHEVLSRQAQEKVTLAELSAQVLAPYGTRIETRGSHVVLRSSATVSFSLILHELATNAAKHGSLSGAGKVEVMWTVNGELALQWTERGGPVVRGNPTRTGFGSKLIKHVVERELGGSVQIEYRSEGVRCLLRVPATAID